MDSHYAGEYGDRWPVLKKALQRDTVKCALLNKYAEGIEGLEGLELVSVEMGGVTCLIFASSADTSDQGVKDEKKLFPKPARDMNSLCYYYLLDMASVLPTIALQIEPHHRVLDVCAAPGGKTVAMAQQLDLTKGRLDANEISNERRLRLLKSVRSYIPPHLQANVRVTGHDATAKGAFPLDFYDRILIDAPCSTDRHVIQQNEPEDLKWSASRLKSDQQRQLALVASAWQALKPGGLLVYATCSLSSIENDDVVRKAVKKHLKNEVEILKLQYSIGEATQFGWIVLPDTCNNWGPLYFACLRKKQLY